MFTEGGQRKPFLLRRFDLPSDRDFIKLQDSPGREYVSQSKTEFTTTSDKKEIAVQLACLTDTRFLLCHSSTGTKDRGKRDEVKGICQARAFTLQSQYDSLKSNERWVVIVTPHGIKEGDTEFDGGSQIDNALKPSASQGTNMEPPEAQCSVSFSEPEVTA